MQNSNSTLDGMVKPVISSVLIILLGILWGCQSKTPAGIDDGSVALPDSNLSFSRHIRPIFLQDCASFGGCHQSHVRAGDLDLESDPPDFNSHSGLVVIPFSKEQSLLYQLLLGSFNGIPRMPPPDRPPLAAEKIRAIGTWIDEGANTSN
ncbi:MAG: hypothetical protein D6681_17460 [Calditrichaeota bacterium]|nr:MAG: hypothetical protein D6681_17460 [Calditrichota bacterium]